MLSGRKKSDIRFIIIMLETYSILLLSNHHDFFSKYYTIIFQLHYVHAVIII